MHSASTRSLAENTLCGKQRGKGTYTAEGINALCEGLKGSAVTALKCATAQYLHSGCTQCQRPMNKRT